MEEEMKKEKKLLEEELHHEFKIKAELEEKRKDIKTFDDLVAFIKDIETNYNCGYGDAPRAMAQAALAVSWYLSSEFGITGFQAGCVMWDFILGWMKTGNQCGLKLVDYDEMLYPQYDYKFDKTISSDTWELLQKRAKELLEEDDNSKLSAHPHVRYHWESIVNGEVPFGYAVVDD